VGGNAGYDSFKTIHVKTFSEEDEGLTFVASASHNTPETDSFIAKYKKPNYESRGSSLKLLMVAEGSAHIYPRLAPTMEWDTCAAQAIVECAGGKVLQAAGDVPADAGKPVVYNKPNLRNPYFIVYGNVVQKKAKKAKKAIKFGEEEKSSLVSPVNIVLVVVLAIAVFYFTTVANK